MTCASYILMLLFTAGVCLADGCPAATVTSAPTAPVCQCYTATSTSTIACPCVPLLCTDPTSNCHSVRTSWIPEDNPQCSTATTTVTGCDCTTCQTGCSTIVRIYRPCKSRRRMIANDPEDYDADCANDLLYMLHGHCDYHINLRV